MRVLRLLLAVIITVVLASPAGAGEREDRLDTLFVELRHAADAEAARPIEAAIWLLWSATGRIETDRIMARGIAAMQRGGFAEALAAFDELVAAAPEWAEAWNKRATLYYLMDDYEASVADIGKTLALEPRHFGALSGLGLIYVAIGNEEAALKAFEKALTIHPHMSGPARFVDILRDMAEDSAI